MLGDVKLQTAQKRILSSLLIFYAFGRAEIRTVIVIPVVRDPNGQLGIDHIVQAYSSSISDYGFRSVLANPKDLEVLGVYFRTEKDEWAINEVAILRTVSAGIDIQAVVYMRSIAQL